MVTTSSIQWIAWSIASIASKRNHSALRARVKRDFLWQFDAKMFSLEGFAVKPSNILLIDMTTFQPIAKQPMQSLPVDLESCEALEIELLQEIATIKAQIARAVSQAKSAGTYASNHWFIDANKSLRHKQAQHQALQTHAAGLRRKMKQQKADNFARYFFDAARTLLPKHTYLELLGEAKRLATMESKKN